MNLEKVVPPLHNITSTCYKSWTDLQCSHRVNFLWSCRQGSRLRSGKGACQVKPNSGVMKCCPDVSWEVWGSSPRKSLKMWTEKLVPVALVRSSRIFICPNDRPETEFSMVFQAGIRTKIREGSLSGNPTPELWRPNGGWRGALPQKNFENGNWETCSHGPLKLIKSLNVKVWRVFIYQTDHFWPPPQKKVVFL